jgi:hypothetical protein
MLRNQGVGICTPENCLHAFIQKPVCVQDTEEALMRAAASGGDGSAGHPLSVSPDYIDALVEAVRDPGIGG